MLQFALLIVRTTIFSTHFDSEPGLTFAFKTDEGLGLHCPKTKSIHITFQTPILLTVEFLFSPSAFTSASHTKSVEALSLLETKLRH